MLWVRVDSGSWWWTGRPGVLQRMGLQRVGHDWATELNWTDMLFMKGLPVWLSGKESTCWCKTHGSHLWVGKISWRKKQQPTPVFLPGKSHGQRSLVGYSPWGHKESQMWLSKSTTLYMKVVLGGTVVDNLPAMQDIQTHVFHPWIAKFPRRREWQPTPLLAWKIPRTGETGRLQSLGSQRVRHDRVCTDTHFSTETPQKENENSETMQIIEHGQ